MTGRWNLFCGQNDEVQYQPVAGDVVDVPEAQDNTELFNQIPADVLVLIAAKLPTEDLIPFLLTNSKTFHLFEDFKGNPKHGALRVLMPTSQQSLYQGAPAEVNFRDVNHVLMAQYQLRIKMDELKANETELRQHDDKRACLATAAIASLGIAIALGVHVGTAFLFDKVILPGCVNCTPIGGYNWCQGNICQATDPMIIQSYYDHAGNLVQDTLNLQSYLGLNITSCWIIGPLLSSIPAGCTAGCLLDGCACAFDRGDNYRGSPLRRCIQGETYDDKHSGLKSKIDDLDSSRKDNFSDILDKNDELRERKNPGVSRPTFLPKLSFMKDNSKARVNNNNDNNAPQAPQRISME